MVALRLSRRLRLDDIVFKNCNPRGSVSQKYVSVGGHDVPKMMMMTVVVVRDFKKIQTSTVVLERLCEWKEKLSSHTPPVQTSHMVQLKTLQ